MHNKHHLDNNNPATVTLSTYHTRPTIHNLPYSTVSSHLLHLPYPTTYSNPLPSVQHARQPSHLRLLLDERLEVLVDDRDGEQDARARADSACRGRDQISEIRDQRSKLEETIKDRNTHPSCQRTRTAQRCTGRRRQQRWGCTCEI